MDSVIAVLSNKGFLIGFFSGLMKVMQSMRAGTFRWFIALTDIGGASLVGYSVYQWAGESTKLAEWQVVAITIMLSINAFFVVHMITDPNFVKNLLRAYIPMPSEKQNDKQEP